MTKIDKQQKKYKRKSPGTGNPSEAKSSHLSVSKRIEVVCDRERIELELWREIRERIDAKNFVCEACGQYGKFCQDCVEFGEFGSRWDQGE